LNEEEEEEEEEEGEVKEGRVDCSCGDNERARVSRAKWYPASKQASK
jgi:hypothetical protein